MRASERQAKLRLAYALNRLLDERTLVERLMNLLTALDHDVEIMIKRKPQKYLLMGDFLGPNETVQQASADELATYNHNQILSAHREVYASFRSDELPGRNRPRVQGEAGACARVAGRPSQEVISRRIADRQLRHRCGGVRACRYSSAGRSRLRASSCRQAPRRWLRAPRAQQRPHGKTRARHLRAIHDTKWRPPRTRISRRIGIRQQASYGRPSTGQSTVPLRPNGCPWQARENGERRTLSKCVKQRH